jgi:aldehyde dehydrogenase (NAD+)
MYEEALTRLGIRVEDINDGVAACEGAAAGAPSGDIIASINPSTGEPIARVRTAARADYDRVVARAAEAFRAWRLVPAPERGEAVRRLGVALREHKADLARLVTLEVGKIGSEAAGEVQEMIDMCDYATGLSRQLYGLTIASERRQHRLFEQWHPLGPVGVISAFNFPVAVWAWNAALAAVCGDTVVWKPSPQAPLTAIAVQRIAERVLADCGAPAVWNLCVSGSEAGRWMAEDRRLPLVSATGSCGMGRVLGPAVAARLGRSLLELGGNNGLIVTESADLDLALEAVVFAAAGTAGQRCTTLRRLIVHESIVEPFTARLAAAYRRLRIGAPWEDGVLIGPLINAEARAEMQRALEAAVEQGGEILCGGRALDRPGYFVEPAIVRAPHDLPIVAAETFAPILYVMAYRDLDEALGLHNSVEQGLASAIFTERLRDAERFLSSEGSDCGIANVNVGTSGAEIGGAFGGEKDTGGGREAGSDAWKSYMRRQTCTVNYGTALPLAQGVRFDVAPRSG